MLILAVVMLIGLALTYIYFRDREVDEQLIEKRSYVPVVGVQIICGDCAGETGFPRKTFVDKTGCCSECGGRSYILAAYRTGLNASVADCGTTLPPPDALDAEWESANAKNDWRPTSVVRGAA